MSRASYILLAVVVIFASVAVVGWSFFGLGTSTPSPSKPQATKQATQSAEQEQELPSLNNPAIVSAEYTFKGTIKDVLQDSSGKLELITDITGTGVPRFLVPRSTEVLIANKEGTRPAKYYNFKKDQTVVITALYKSKPAMWSFKSILIVYAYPKTSSPSSTLSR